MEFFESPAGSETLTGATMLSEAADCGFRDCNENGVHDALDVAEGASVVFRKSRDFLSRMLQLARTSARA